MTDREQYTPGPARGALRHPPAMVWQALTDPAHLSEWAPFDAEVTHHGGSARDARPLGPPGGPPRWARAGGRV